MKQTAGGGRPTAVSASRGAGPDALDMERRDVVKILAAASLAALGVGAPEIARAAAFADDATQQGAPPYVPVFFTKAEWPMVRSLANLVIPRDARSGGATDAGVPEFMDFIMHENPSSQKRMRYGLNWLNAECTRRFNHDWLKCAGPQQHEMLNDIAFPKKAKAALKPGVEFFTQFRDLTSTGFWTSRIGMADLGYVGNRTVPEWKGCPEPQLVKLGVSYKMSMHAVRRG